VKEGTFLEKPAGVLPVRESEKTGKHFHCIRCGKMLKAILNRGSIIFSTGLSGDADK
jgi:hypothetical protein